MLFGANAFLSTTTTASRRSEVTATALLPRLGHRRDLEVDRLTVHGFRQGPSTAMPSADRHPRGRGRIPLTPNPTPGGRGGRQADCPHAQPLSRRARGTCGTVGRHMPQRAAARKLRYFSRSLPGLVNSCTVRQGGVGARASTLFLLRGQSMTTFLSARVHHFQAAGRMAFALLIAGGFAYLPGASFRGGGNEAFAAGGLALGQAPVPRTSYDILPGTPVRLLLPRAPKADKSIGPLLSDDLAKVPQIFLEAQLPRSDQPATAEEHARAIERVALTRSKIMFLNRQKTDVFMAALLAKRPDLSGLSVATGDDCRLSSRRAEMFQSALATVRAALANPAPPPAGAPPEAVDGPPSDAFMAAGFWKKYHETIQVEDRRSLWNGQCLDEHVTPARVAALMQVLGPNTPALRLGLVNYLAGVAHVDSTKALARLAIFSAEENVRRAALDALKVRRGGDYRAILLTGLRYPYPAVAKRTAEALVHLQRVDFVGELVALLDEPDPRAPVVKEVGQKKTQVVREL